MIIHTGATTELRLLCTSKSMPNGATDSKLDLANSVASISSRLLSNSSKELKIKKLNKSLYITMLEEMAYDKHFVSKAQSLMFVLHVTFTRKYVTQKRRSKNGRLQLEEKKTKKELDDFDRNEANMRGERRG